MPRRPYQKYTTDYDTLMREAKATLGRADALERQRNRETIPYSELPQSQEAKEPVDNSFFGKVKRFGQNIKDVTIPTDRLSDVWEGPAYALKNPGDALSLLSNSVKEGYTAETEKAANAPTLSEFLGHKAASYIPFIGPSAAHAGGQFAEGDIAGGAGSTVGLLAPFLLGGLRGGKTTERPIPRRPAFGEKVRGGPIQLPVEFEELNRVINEPEPTPPAHPRPTRQPLDLFDTLDYQRAPAPVRSPEAVASEGTITPSQRGDWGGAEADLPTLGLDDTGSTVAQGPAKPRLTAPDVAAMLKGREKFRTTNPDATLPPGAMDELDRMGVEYGRTQRTLKDLLGMSDADPAEVARMKQGARELGSRLRVRAKQAVEPFEPPPQAPEPFEPPPQASEPTALAVQDLPEFSHTEQPIPTAQEAPGWDDVNDMLRSLGGKLREVPTSKAKMAEQLAEEPPASLKVVGSGRTAAASRPAPSIADMLRASIEDQKEKAGSGELPPPPGREGHFTLPKPSFILPEAEQLKMLADDLPRMERRQQNTGATTGERRITEPSLEDLGRQVEPGAPYEAPPIIEDPKFQQEFGPQRGSVLDNERGSVNFGPGIEKLQREVLDPDPGPAVKAQREKWGAEAQTHQASSLLASPSIIAKILTSNTSSALQKAALRSAKEKSLSPLKNLFRELSDVKTLGREAVDAFQNPDTVHTRLDSGSAPLPTTGLRGLLSIGSRMVGAADRPFRGAMERAGFPSEDALTVTQQRHPITDFGKGAVAFQQRNIATRLLMPFVKSGANAFETGMIEPLQSVRRIAAGTAAADDYLNVAMATGAAAGYYAMSDSVDQLPTWARPLALAGAGLYTVPAAIAYAAAHAPDGVRASFVALQRSVPMAEGFNLDNPSSFTGRVVPRSLNPDYWTGTKRKTDGFWQKIQAQVPGLAQMLPPKPPMRAPRAKHVQR